MVRPVQQGYEGLTVVALWKPRCGTAVPVARGECGAFGAHAGTPKLGVHHHALLPYALSASSGASPEP